MARRAERDGTGFPAFAARSLFIRTKSGAIRRLALNPVQKDLHARLEAQRARTGRVRALVLKARQPGVSTYVEARYYWHVTHRRGVRAFILTHQREATDVIFEMVHRFWDKHPAKSKPHVGASNAKELWLDALDLNILSEHITAGGIVDLAYQQEPDSTLWTVRADGQVPALTYQPDQNVVGWSRCRFGGLSAACETVAVIAGDGRDEVWLCVRRIVDGQSVRHIEYLDAAFEHGGDSALACYADSALIYDGAPTDTVAGLDHIEGETVAILADGAVHPPRTVSGGAVALDYAAGRIVVGLPYAHTYQSLKWEAGNPAGTSQGQVKRIHGVTLILLDALNAMVGPDEANLKTVPFRSVSDPMDSAVPLFTGEKFVEFDSDFATDTRVVLKGVDPVPFTLLAVAPEIKTNAR